jgi:predicted LPLAT superfamily acyltransferase
VSSQPLWLLQRERGSALLMHAIARVALLLGRPVGRALLHPICAYFFVFSRGARQASRDYLARVLPRQPLWLDPYLHLLCFARTILDRVFLLCGNLDDFDCTLEGVDVLRSHLADGKGCLLVGAHFGSFDLLRVIGSMECPVKVNVLMHEENAAKINGVFATLDSKLPMLVIPLGQPHTMLHAAEAIRRGEIVALLADRAVAGDRMVRCDFLGGEALFPQGPFMLAAMLGAPVILFAAVYEGGRRYRVSFTPFAERMAMPARRPAASIELCYQRYADWLAANCRRAPYNWFNFYDFWVRDHSR